MSQLLRTLKETDLAQILQIEHDLFGPTAWNAQMFLDEISRIGTSRWYQVLIDNDEIIGYVGVAFAGTSADIQTIAVINSRQRCGIGSQLLELAIAEIEQRGISEIFLEVAVENSSAILFYENFGFTKISIRPNYYGPGKNAHVMMRQAGAS